MSQPQAVAAMRRAGALAALLAASALMGIPAVAEAGASVVLALHVIWQLGCAAVLLSTAHGAVAGLARRAAQPGLDTGLGASGTWILRWLGFACIVTYALYVAGDVAVPPARNEAAAEVEAASLDTVEGFLLFLVFLAGVWAVNLSMVMGRGGPPSAASAAAAAEEHPDGEVNAMASRLAGVVVDS